MILQDSGRTRKLNEHAILAIDTEFDKTHTLTIQVAARLDAGTIAVQVYRSCAIPDMPPSVHQLTPKTLAQGGYDRFCDQFLFRPTRTLTPDLSPARMFRDVFGVTGLDVRSRSEGRGLIDLFGLTGPQPPVLVPGNVRRSRKGDWRVPDLNLTLVGHYLTADFGRIHGRDFLSGLLSRYWRDRAGVVMRHRKILSFVEQNGPHTDTVPVLEYAYSGSDFHGVRVEMRDTMLPYGPGGLDGLCQTFLKLSKSPAITPAEKANMLKTFHSRPHDAYTYAVADAVNTLLLHEAMQEKDRDIYRAFGFADPEIPPMRPTVGGRVSTFMMKTTRSGAAAGSENLRSERGLEALMRKGGIGLFRQHSDASRYGDQTGKVQGGLLYSRSPTRWWHESAGMLRDVDMAGCYNEVIARLTVYWGRPIVFEPGCQLVTLKDAVKLVQESCDRDAWLIRVSGAIEGDPNALIPSADNAVTSVNYRERLRKGKRRQARQKAFHLEALRDPGSVKGTGGSRLYAARVESGVVTWATWLMIQALPPALRRRYENLTADSILFYPKFLAARDGAEYDALVERHRTEALPWDASLDLEGMRLIQRVKLDAEYVSLRYPIDQFARQIGQFRKDAQRTEGKGSGADQAWKVHANSMYGVLASSYLPTNNFVAANQVSAQARAEAFALSQALNAIQTITDGCTYRLDQIPACTYEECLKVRPDYPIRRAEAGEGIPFLDPKDIPQDDAGFTAWYRDHVKRFFGVSGAEYDDLFGTHKLEHKKTGVSKRVEFDALACDGSGNYLKVSRDGKGGWVVEDFAARSYRRESKTVVQDWMLRTYATDRLTNLAPVAEDPELLSFKKAGQKARRALDDGVPEVYYPLGLENRKVMNYKAIKASAFVFETPEQRAAVVKQLQKFEQRTQAGLELVTLRRGYRGRRAGSLVDLAEELYRLIRRGETNLTKALNLNKPSTALEGVARGRRGEVRRRKAEAERRLLDVIDSRNLEPEALPTAYLVTDDEVGVHEAAVEVASAAG